MGRLSSHSIVLSGPVVASTDAASVESCFGGVGGSLLAGQSLLPPTRGVWAGHKGGARSGT